MDSATGCSKNLTTGILLLIPNDSEVDTHEQDDPPPLSRQLVVVALVVLNENPLNGPQQNEAQVPERVQDSTRPVNFNLESLSNAITLEITTLFSPDVTEFREGRRVEVGLSLSRKVFDSVLKVGLETTDASWAQFTQDTEHLATCAHKLWNTLWSMGVFTQLASNIKGFAPKFACKCAYASCVNGLLKSQGSSLRCGTYTCCVPFPAQYICTLTIQNSLLASTFPSVTNTWETSTRVLRNQKKTAHLPNFRHFSLISLAITGWTIKSNRLYVTIF